jgi:hypothetical protein
MTFQSEVRARSCLKGLTIWVNNFLFPKNGFRLTVV